MNELLSLALDARVMWALSRIEMTAAGMVSDSAIDLMNRATWAAESVGAGAYGHDPMPALLADVPQLAQAWRAGYAVEEEFARQANIRHKQMREMIRSAGGNDGTGTPCRIHG
ncbi:hypothetical protein AWB69_08947 [Caballeronia udeis]|uniref:Uncharacterized protein n=1 Tax=Caballeronia udeis TaxID=1232866 RepID=A0A158JWK6_9BURK|nr:hypothetical protein [Caballeronia udeis]SAL73197.1 hypothetical protein AWB69_08947 [Caballeronia udeis]